MKTHLTRAAVVAATRIVQDGFQSISPAAIAHVMEEAHISIFNADVDKSTPKARSEFNDAVDLAGDLMNFAIAIKASR